jgi:5'-methylthioinosine phosphorylase
VSGLWAVIGGSGLNRLAPEWETVGSDETPYGRGSGAVQRASIGDRPVLFLARHGQPHRIPPHRINYRANLWLLAQAGARAILATNAVGGIAAAMHTGDLLLPDQVVDYTWGREHTVMDESRLEHVDFTEPYHGASRARILAAARQLAPPVRLHASGTYGCTQGPRLESAAEIARLERDGCDVVGMTGMPEAGLAREMGLRYAAICLVVNPAAGKAGGPLVEADILRVAEVGMRRVADLIARVVAEPPPD